MAQPKILRFILDDQLNERRLWFQGKMVINLHAENGTLIRATIAILRVIDIRFILN